MSDLTKSKILRMIIAALAMLGIVIIVGGLDHLIDKLTGMKDGNVIESAVFLVVTFNFVWGWLSRRVWIGSVPSTDSGAK